MGGSSLGNLVGTSVHYNSWLQLAWASKKRLTRIHLPGSISFTLSFLRDPWPNVFGCDLAGFLFAFAIFLTFWAILTLQAESFEAKVRTGGIEWPCAALLLAASMTASSIGKSFHRAISCPYRTLEGVPLGMMWHHPVISTPPNIKPWMPGHAAIFGSIENVAFTSDLCSSLEMIDTSPELLLLSMTRAG